MSHISDLVSLICQWRSCGLLCSNCIFTLRVCSQVAPVNQITSEIEEPSSVVATVEEPAIIHPAPSMREEPHPPSLDVEAIEAMPEPAAPQPVVVIILLSPHSMAAAWAAVLRSLADYSTPANTARTALTTYMPLGHYIHMYQWRQYILSLMATCTTSDGCVSNATPDSADHVTPLTTACCVEPDWPEPVFGSFGAADSTLQVWSWHQEPVLVTPFSTVFNTCSLKPSDSCTWDAPTVDTVPTPEPLVFGTFIDGWCVAPAADNHPTAVTQVPPHTCTWAAKGVTSGFRADAPVFVPAVVLNPQPTACAVCTDEEPNWEEEDALVLTVRILGLCA